MGSRRWRWLAIAALVSSGCSSNSSTAPSTSIASSPASSTAGPEPTGVPGLAAEDPFCSAWATYVGTLQVLGIAASFGELSSGRLASLELVAATRLVGVAAAIDASWPPELAAERSIVVERRIGPYARRAQRAVDVLFDAGVTDAELASLRSAWQDALSVRNPEAPVIELAPLAAELQSKLDAAAAAYDGAVTPFNQDPSLVVDEVAAPETDAYLAARCPDLASLGVGDAL